MAWAIFQRLEAFARILSLVLATRSACRTTIESIRSFSEVDAGMSIRVKDIAERVGVSPTTVSLVLNNKPGAGDELRERILKTARELGYTTFRSSRAHSLCLLHITRHGHAVNRDHDVFLADYIEGLSQGAKQAGFTLEIVTFKPAPITQVIEAALSKTAVGFIVLGTELSREEVESFQVVRKPLVFIDTYHEFLNFDFVDMNNEDSVFEIISHLVAKGHRAIGMVKGAIETRNFKLREEGFIESLSRFGLEFDPARVFAVDSTFHGAFEDMSSILAHGTRLPAALFCANDIIACGCLRAIRQAGLRVPEDVSVIGFDDLPISATSDPPLTTIKVSKAQIGRMAIQLLISRLHSDPEAPSAKVLIGGQLVERQSVIDLGNPVLPGSSTKAHGGTS
ncbi:MAG: LacI family DNA-binding transcriptional regulator [Rectinemataceae bacterium]